MNALDARKEIQNILGVTQDGDLGPETMKVFGAAGPMATALIQKVLHVAEDGIVGTRTLEALEHLRTATGDAPWPSQPPAAEPDTHHVLATSFADPADIAAFRHCKAQGRSDQSCFAVGDNGLGFGIYDCTAGSGPACALPPEFWMARWGSRANASKKKVEVVADGITVICELRDTMPHLANIRNGAGIDLNYDAWKALGHIPPQERPATWRWA